MYKGIKRGLFILAAGAFVLSACGISNKENINSELIEESQQTQEVETETVKVEITDALEILTKVWDEYEEEDRFEILGGHLENAELGNPAKYNLAEGKDLEQMYCVPDCWMYVMNDAATMIDLYNAARFTAGAYRLWDTDELQTVAYEMKSQVFRNKWHGEKPEKLLIAKINEEYVVSVYGREALVDEFEQKLLNVYSDVLTIIVEEKLF